MRLFHFSDDPTIEFFAPRPVLVPSTRPEGLEWLNGPLVWAIDDFHQPMYLFPRDCPRVLCWPKQNTTQEDRNRWWGKRTCRMIAHVEWTWFERLRTEPLYRYELPEDSFFSLEDAGMWVSREPVVPMRMVTLPDLPAELRAQGVELRVMESLIPLQGLWATSLHTSGLRLRNAVGYYEAAGARSRAETGEAGSSPGRETAASRV